jgi:hypothetical protein
MSCYDDTNPSLTTLSTKSAGRQDPLPVVRGIVTFFEAFHEALEMRRVACRQ